MAPADPTEIFDFMHIELTEELKAQKEELKEKNYQLQQRIEELNNSIPSSESLTNNLTAKKIFRGSLVIVILVLSIFLLFFRN